MNRIDTHNRWNLAGIGLLILLGTLFLAESGIVQSSYHFVDDHEIISMNAELADSDFLSVAKAWCKNDLDIRYRPLYMAHRVLQTSIFSTDFRSWQAYVGLLFIISLVFFFLSFRRYGHSLVLSLLGVMIIFLGAQMEVWWRLGPNETLGMGLLSVACYLASGSKTNRANTMLFAIFLSASSLCKESFTAIMPAMIYLYLSRREIDMKAMPKFILKSPALLFTILVMCINVGMILFYVGTNEIEYAGVGNEGSIEIIKGMLDVLFLDLGPYLGLAAGLGIGILILSRKSDSTIQKEPLMKASIFFALILLPNLIMYAKSGIFARYYLPSTLGLAWLIVTLIAQMEKLQRPLALALSGLMLMGCIPAGIKVIKKAKGYVRDGQSATQFLQTLVAGNSSDHSILLVADPIEEYEYSNSADIYLRLEHERQVRAKVLGDIDLDNPLYKKWREQFFRDRVETSIAPQIDVIALLGSQSAAAQQFTQGLDKKEWRPLDCPSPFQAWKRVE